MTFIFKDYSFDRDTATARFRYGFNGVSYEFEETMQFAQPIGAYDEALLDRALFLAFCLVGTSYYKTFAGSDVHFERGSIDEWQSMFLAHVYQEGLSQYAFENKLTRDDLAHFSTIGDRKQLAPLPYVGEGVLVLQSGGKDSLLVASSLEKQEIPYTPWYVSQGASYPRLLDKLKYPLRVAKRRIDREHLSEATAAGARNGHVPVTYIMMSYAVVQAILSGHSTVLVAIGHEGEEPHEWLGDLPVNHQWSKTWQAEQLFAEYVTRYISPDIHVGSPLRSLSELRVAELFVDTAWERFGASFSSCNEANYRQGVDNETLQWCGTCPKCANSYLLFAPFVEPHVLHARLGGALFEKAALESVFKGLLGIDGVMKPFECVGEVDELRAAYHAAQANGYESLSFAVPVSAFNRYRTYPSQDKLAHYSDVKGGV